MAEDEKKPTAEEGHHEQPVTFFSLSVPVAAAVLYAITALLYFVHAYLEAAEHHHQTHHHPDHEESHRHVTSWWVNNAGVLINGAVAVTYAALGYVHFLEGKHKKEKRERKKKVE
jgi:hypothetical protein